MAILGQKWLFFAIFRGLRAVSCPETLAFERSTHFSHNIKKSAPYVEYSKNGGQKGFAIPCVNVPFVSKKISVQKFFGSIRLWFQKHFVPKNIFGPKNVGPKKNWVQRSLGPKKLWVKKKCLVQKILGPKKCPMSFTT